jgi:hypothetical protein
LLLVVKLIVLFEKDDNPQDNNPWFVAWARRRRRAPNREDLNEREDEEEL